MTAFATLARRAHALWRWIERSIRLLLKAALAFSAILLLLLLFGNGTLSDTSLRAHVTAIARDGLFDYVAWEADALWGKARQELFGVQSYLDDGAQRRQVIAFLERLADAQDLDAQIERLYADPTIADPDAASADLRARRDALRRQLDRDQPLVESIIEQQVSAVLVDEGFATLGQVMPPVSMHFTEVPMALIISPRARIEFAVDLDLNPLPVEERAALEDRIDGALDVSSLVVPLGGLSLYPSMVVEPSARDLPSKLARAFEVTAHEWAHHYLVFYPLGWEYSARPDTRIINETAATFFGQEIARKAMARYYPDLPAPQYASFLNAAAAPAASSPPAEPPHDPDAPPPFDYDREMNATRIQMDFLLSQGKIRAAETYMEAQRRKFARHGYAIRKLNQAYFAFYGGYQGSPGAGGSDPIGPAIEELRLLSPDLRGWMRTIRDITTREALLAVVEGAQTQ